MRARLDHAEIDRLAAEGLKCRQIAERLGYSEAGVYAALNREKNRIKSKERRVRSKRPIDRRMSGSDRIDAAKAIALRQSGMTYSQVAETLGCSEGGAYRACNQESQNAYAKSYAAQRRANDPEFVARANARLRKHARKRAGIVDATDEMPDSPCEICGRSGLRMCCDHDHDTGKIRGWLCSSCNRGLGYLQDSPRLLATALAYLAKSGKAWQ